MQDYSKIITKSDMIAYLAIPYGVDDPIQLASSNQEYESNHFVQITKELTLVYLASCSSSGSHGYNPQARVQSRRGLRETEFQEMVNEALYESDEFRMYGFKITMCPRVRSHDWTSCPFAHRGEKARRRDLRLYNYAAIPCPNYKREDCTRGNDCQFAHGVFEYWLHPARYRTRPCRSSIYCRRKVCFFAHTPEELRPETKYQWCYVYRPVAAQPYVGVDVGGEASTSGVVVPYSAPQPQHVPTPVPQPSHARPNTNVYIREGMSSHEASSSSSRWQIQDPDFPDIQWISELIDET